MGRAHTFFGKCIREAAQGTVKLANAWYWPLAIPLVALGEYFCLDSLPPGSLADLWAGRDERRALIAFAVLTVAVSWLLFFFLRLIGAPARLYAAAQAKICALAAEVEEREAAQESDIALVFAADDLASERRVLPHDDVASKSGAPDVGSGNQAPRYSVAVNNVGDNVLRDCQVNVQIYGDAWLAPDRRLIPVPIPVGEKILVAARGIEIGHAHAGAAGGARRGAGDRTLSAERRCRATRPSGACSGELHHQGRGPIRGRPPGATASAAHTRARSVDLAARIQGSALIGRRGERRATVETETRRIAPIRVGRHHRSHSGGAAAGLDWRPPRDRPASRLSADRPPGRN
jgi:hypothetical protein